jgi:hypothetical protein
VWCSSLIPVTQEVEIRGSGSRPALGKSMRFYTKNKLNKIGMEHGLSSTVPSKQTNKQKVFSSSTEVEPVLIPLVFTIVTTQ